MRGIVALVILGAAIYAISNARAQTVSLPEGPETDERTDLPIVPNTDPILYEGEPIIPVDILKEAAHELAGAIAETAVPGENFVLTLPSFFNEGEGVAADFAIAVLSGETYGAIAGVALAAFNSLETDKIENEFYNELTDALAAYGIVPMDAPTGGWEYGDPRLRYRRQFVLVQ